MVQQKNKSMNYMVQRQQQKRKVNQCQAEVRTVVTLGRGYGSNSGHEGLPGH